MKYNKEEALEGILNLFENEGVSRKVMICGIENYLDAAYKAGEEKVKNKIKECVNTCSDDISYLDSNSNDECIRIFKVNLEALK